DGGETWAEHAFSFDTAFDPTLRAVDPKDPNTVFVSTYNPYALLRSTDGGATFEEVLSVPGYVSDFVMSEDGARAWVSDPVSGIHLSEDGGVTFELLAGSPHAACLARTGTTVWACASRPL